ncbi:platelet-derived growth factor receptor-like protein isoform X1 [Lethenteron reissneri]|uniref:platelet-derived growth factor receptor-like protein isoform X1 n=1 Tax=Lethenteron reissneri TaxID=7753 RepID=UPI002AB7E7CE|nr:platelet-derived growth factor receptor-like protein isoform X1 [Lethenteron reissneri]
MLLFLLLLLAGTGVGATIPTKQGLSAKVGKAEVTTNVPEIPGILQNPENPDPEEGVRSLETPAGTVGTIGKSEVTASLRGKDRAVEIELKASEKPQKLDGATRFQEKVGKVATGKEPQEKEGKAGLKSEMASKIVKPVTVVVVKKLQKPGVGILKKPTGEGDKAQKGSKLENIGNPGSTGDLGKQEPLKSAEILDAKPGIVEESGVIGKANVVGAGGSGKLRTVTSGIIGKVRIPQAKTIAQGNGTIPNKKGIPEIYAKVGLLPEVKANRSGNPVGSALSGKPEGKPDESEKAGVSGKDAHAATVGKNGTWFRRIVAKNGTKLQGSVRINGTKPAQVIVGTATQRPVSAVLARRVGAVLAPVRAVEELPAGTRNLVLRCRAEYVAWRYPAHLHDLPDALRISSGPGYSELTLHNSTSADTGAFSCRGNSSSINGTRIATATTYIYFTDPSTLLVSRGEPFGLVVARGPRPAVVPCRATNPRAHVQLQSASHAGSAPPNVTYDPRVGFLLEIPPPEAAGLLRCVATLGGVRQSSVPYLLVYVDSPSEAPVAALVASTSAASLQDDVTLVCEVKGQAGVTADVSWKFPGQQAGRPTVRLDYYEDFPSVRETRSVLLIPAFLAHDAGEYQCSAHNAKGVSIATANIILLPGNPIKAGLRDQQQPINSSLEEVKRLYDQVKKSESHDRKQPIINPELTGQENPIGATVKPHDDKQPRKSAPTPVRNKLFGNFLNRKQPFGKPVLSGQNKTIGRFQKPPVLKQPIKSVGLATQKLAIASLRSRGQKQPVKHGVLRQSEEIKDIKSSDQEEIGLVETGSSEQAL